MIQPKIRSIPSEKLQMELFKELDGNINKLRQLRERDSVFLIKTMSRRMSLSNLMKMKS